MARARDEAGGPGQRAPVGDWRLVPAGFVVAAWSAMCGIGGGLFAVPLLHYLFRLRLEEAVATALGLVAATTAAATVGELLHAESALDGRIVLCLVAGSLVGAQLGFRTARRIRTRALKGVFGLLLPAVGLQLLLAGRPGAEAGGALAFGLGQAALSVAVGLGAGFLSPLLGIGGGLIAVPGLYYGVAGLGYLGARACSLAMGVVNAGRSLWLYHATGLVRLRPALLLGVGGVAGALLGVRLVHLPELARLARGMMGLTLVFVGLRFLHDARARS